MYENVTISLWVQITSHNRAEMANHCHISYNRQDNFVSTYQETKAITECILTNLMI